MKNIKQSHSILILVGAILVPIILIVLVYNIGFRTKSPEITILEPVNNSSIQASSVIVKGKVTPVYSKVSINDKDISVSNGNFEYEMKLDDSSEINNVYIKATNKDTSDSEMLTVKRIFTDEEKKQIEDNKLKEEQVSLTKDKAELVCNDKQSKQEVAYERLCKKILAVVQSELKRAKLSDISTFIS